MINTLYALLVSVKVISYWRRCFRQHVTRYILW